MNNERGRAGGFNKPKGGAFQLPTLHLYVANCGPSVGLSFASIERAFSFFGPVAGVQLAGDSGTRVVVSFRELDHAVAAKEAWSGHPCDVLEGRIMFMQYSVPRSSPASENRQNPAMVASSELGIPGLMLYPDFVSVEEEQELLAGVDSVPWKTLAKRRVQHHGYEFLYKSRNVDLSKRLGDFPAFLGQLVEKLSSLPKLTEAEELSLPLNQLTVNEYPPGVGLSPHIDTHSAFEGSILSLSLAGPCVMEFRRYHSFSGEPEESLREDVVVTCTDPASVVCEEKKLEQKALFLPQRSLLVLSSEARYAWHHYIPHRKVDFVIGEAVPRSPRRVSFTFRKVRSGSCECKFVKYCDSQIPGLAGSLLNVENLKCVAAENLSEHGFESPADGEECVLSSVESNPDDLYNNQEAASTPPWSTSMASDLHAVETSVCQRENKFDESFPKAVSLATPEIEKLYVHKVYDAIAPHFSSTRFAKWPKVNAFLEALTPGSIVADSGCGNGKYLGSHPKCFFIGCDISPPLVSICAQRGHEALVADALHLPHRTGFYDAAISIAVLHHLSTAYRRKRAIEELVRIVCSGSKILITVWAREQEDAALLKKWRPLGDKYLEEWVGDQNFNSHGLRHESPPSSLEKILEGDVSMGDQHGMQLNETHSTGTASGHHQEYFVPWHLPYHRAEVNGASASAVASGFARKDEKKGAVIYDRYYHVFAEGELERIASEIQGATIVDHFYDKSNWCIILQKS